MRSFPSSSKRTVSISASSVRRRIRGRKSPTNFAPAVSAASPNAGEPLAEEVRAEGARGGVPLTEEAAPAGEPMAEQADPQPSPTEGTPEL